MKEATVLLESTSAYGQGKMIQVPKKPKENHEDYEARTWRERCHYDEQTREIFIPPFAFKNCISECAKFISMKKSGSRGTYTKHFEAGVLVLEGLPLGVTVDDVKGQWRHVPSDGVPGGGKRVMKCFPYVDSWRGAVTYHILDDIITEDVFRTHIDEAGKFIGLGVSRPRNRGIWGRFAVKNVDWQDMT